MAGYVKLIDWAIKQVRGRKLPIGCIAAHPDDPIARVLVRYEDDGRIAVLSLGGVTKRWPASEIFDLNEVERVAVQVVVARQLELREHFAEN